MEQRVTAAIERALAGVDGLTVKPGPMGELVIHAADWRETVIALEHQTKTDHALVLLVRIADETEADPLLMLQLAGRIGAGAISHVGRSYALRFTVPMAKLDQADLGQVISYLRALAVEVAGIARRSRAADTTDGFAHWV